MATGKISKRSVDAMKPDTTKPKVRDAYLWDGELHGFGVKCTPAGKKAYLIQYRVGGRRGRTRRFAIGSHGVVTPDKAREEAKRLLGVVAAGGDPAEDRTQARKAITVGELCDLYLEEGLGEKKASTVAMDRIRIENHVKPLLGSRQAINVSQGDVERFMSTVGKRAGKSAASRTVGMLGAIFVFAARRGHCKVNPCRGIERPKDRRVERFLSSAELARLGEALAKAANDDVNPYAVAAIKALILTGARKAEILTLRWDHIDWDHKCLRLPDSKTGQKIITLGAPAIELLSGLPHIEDNPYVFPGLKEGAHLVGLQKIWNQLREDAGLSDVRLHDLRHSFASVGAAGGDSLLILGKLLGHKNASSTARYAHLGDDPLRAAADKISHHIDAAMRNGNGGEVVDLKRGA